MTEYEKHEIIARLNANRKIGKVTPKRETESVEILHTGSHCRYRHYGVVSVHEEDSYTVLVKTDGTTLKYPTRYIWRLKCRPETP